MSFVYRFLDIDNNVLYIGKTKNLIKRISQHFLNGHLNEECYLNCHSIEYMTTLNEIESDFAEIYLINKYKPAFNIQFKHDTNIDVDFKLNEEWNKYDFEIEKAKYLYIHNKKREIRIIMDEVLELKEKQRNINERLCSLEESLKNITSIDINGIDNSKRENDEDYNEFLSILYIIRDFILNDNNVNIKKNTEKSYFVNVKNLWENNFKEYKISRNTFLKLCKNCGIFNGNCSDYYKSTRLSNGNLVKCYIFNLKNLEIILQEA